jgi:hypothetical protein
VPAPSSPQNGQDGDDDSTEDDDDLDAPPKSQGQSQSQGRTPLKPPPRKSSTPEPSPPPKATTPPATKAKVKNFRIGGKSRRATESPPPLPQAQERPDPDTLPTRESVPPSSQPEIQANVTPKKVRRAFKIGGKGRAVDDETSQRAGTASPSTNRIRASRSPTAELPSSPSPPKAVKEMTPVKEAHEETPEEKAERKRAELKRKNEEAAKKQAQSKKKKRF